MEGVEGQRGRGMDGAEGGGVEECVFPHHKTTISTGHFKSYTVVNCSADMEVEQQRPQTC